MQPRRSMAARKKPLQTLTTDRLALDMEGLSEKDQATIEKDRCLLEAALSADRIIVTLDESLRATLAKTPRNAKLLANITWVNPTTNGVAVLQNL